MTLSTLCKYLNNYFPVMLKVDTFTIENGTIDLSEMLEYGDLHNEQYFRIAGSVFNDGVYQYTESLTGLTDETFYGSITPMAVPKEITDLLTEITAWQTAVAEDSHATGPFTSESFGGYSYTKASGSGAGDSSDPTTWMGHFKGRLSQWRKI